MLKFKQLPTLMVSFLCLITFLSCANNNEIDKIKDRIASLEADNKTLNAKSDRILTKIAELQNRLSQKESTQKQKENKPQSNDYQKIIIGKWLNQRTSQFENLKMEVSSTLTFSEGGIFSLNSPGQFPTTASGTWRIDGDVVIVNGKMTTYSSVSKIEDVYNDAFKITDKNKIVRTSNSNHIYTRIE